MGDQAQFSDDISALWGPDDTGAIEPVTPAPRHGAEERLAALERDIRLLLERVKAGLPSTLDAVRTEVQGDLDTTRREILAELDRRMAEVDARMQERLDRVAGNVAALVDRVAELERDTHPTRLDQQLADPTPNGVDSAPPRPMNGARARARAGADSLRALRALPKSIRGS